MDREQVERELSETFSNIKKIIDDAYVSGYKDGYFECMVHKHNAFDEIQFQEDKHGYKYSSSRSNK